MINNRAFDQRIQVLNDRPVRSGRYVLYWMQQSQRAAFNHALEYAIDEANSIGQGVVVGFGLMDNYPEANARHYLFMLQGLRDTEGRLKKRGIRMVVRRGNPSDIALELGQQASIIVCDRGYLRHQKQWRRQVAASARCRVVQVESDVVVPVFRVSGKAEYAARTIRPKIHRHLQACLVELRGRRPRVSTLEFPIAGMPIDHPADVLEQLSINRAVKPVPGGFVGGTSEAIKRFDRFLAQRVGHYSAHSNQPQTDDVSTMSPYLHFGQISPNYLALKLQRHQAVPNDEREAFLEELVVRRELAVNFVEYTPNYDGFEALPGWAKTTLAEHKTDRRSYLYPMRALEAADTHDAYWNAAMREMKSTGFLHNYMRMYWGKKILEWSETPEQGFRTTLKLNNTYFIDGRDPNSYAGVAWVFGLHDRAWKERPIFGKIRYMAASGLERKFDVDAYLRKVDRLEAGKEFR